MHVAIFRVYSVRRFYSFSNISIFFEFRIQMTCVLTSDIHLVYLWKMKLMEDSNMRVHVPKISVDLKPNDVQCKYSWFYKIGTIIVFERIDWLSRAFSQIIIFFGEHVMFDQQPAWQLGFWKKWTSKKESLKCQIHSKETNIWKKAAIQTNAQYQKMGNYTHEIKRIYYYFFWMGQPPHHIEICILYWIAKWDSQMFMNFW